MTWPGREFPWSDECMPEWCINGYDLVVAFEAAAALSGLSPGPEEETYPFVYPWQGSYRDPHTAACSIKSWVCTQVESWTEEATKTLPRLPREVVEQVSMRCMESFFLKEVETHMLIISITLLRSISWLTKSLWVKSAGSGNQEPSAPKNSNCLSTCKAPMQTRHWISFGIP